MKQIFFVSFLLFLFFYINPDIILTVSIIGLLDQIKRVERKGLRAGMLVGIAGVIMAWPVYQKVVRKERSRAADEIMRLTAKE